MGNAHKQLLVVFYYGRVAQARTQGVAACPANALFLDPSAGV